MPPRRARPAAPPPPKTETKKAAKSKLGKELGLSAQEELEIKEAFEFFAHTNRGSDMEDNEHEQEDEDEEDEEEVGSSRKRRKVPAKTSKAKEKQKALEEKVLPTDELKNALKALGFEFDRNEMREIREAVDPENEGIVSYEGFFQVCALKMKHRDTGDEVEKAYALFTGGEDGPITIKHLRKVAKEIREQATDEDLMDMLREASGKDKVNRKEFEEVMRRAGAI
ncbi:EF-hand [Ascobolus immersus RN42]|uniref:EF-hand n=1 Tax=Ascobolus immersus RN42 TaxID=1160509 RepID=A0A3N4I193_ASCIM|nr:EF-hand [Ascobolus immersus RN42]